ncbi:MAG: 3-dehydroquinate synthase [Lachnospiraceae bacterium]|nr:3-dehydroquinate synthase [Lachnospiraceae bacterium]
MSKRLPVKKDDVFCYDIVFEQDFSNLGKEIANVYDDIKDRKFCIVTDSNVGPLYESKVRDALSNAAGVDCYTFPAGEESKNLSVVQSVYEFLIKEKYTRKDVLIALGGGVVGDLTGFTAATYLRGIDFIQVPTSLLSQVDSSIGGKTGVDFSQYKNMVGAFHMPRLVYTNLSTLNDLPGIQYYAGMGEVLKAGLLKDANFYAWTINHLYEIHDKDFETLEKMVYESCRIKKEIVEKDPYEKGDRALLNLGHTLGHAIEKYKNFELLHGECVALGTVCAAYISWKRGMITDDDYYEVRDMFVPFNLPITIDRIVPEEIVELTKNDKKMSDGHVKFILLDKIGKAVVDHTVTEQEMLDALNEIYFSEEDMKA